MICKNCSAEISEKELLCPYCGTENFDVAKSEQEEYLAHFKKKRDEVKNIPEKMMKNGPKKILKVVGTLIGVAVVVLVVVAGFSRIMAGDSLAKQQKQIEKLEAYYQAGDYEQMCEYYEKLEVYGGSFEKYARICRLYSNMDWRIEALKSNREFAAQIDMSATDVEVDFDRCFSDLHEISEMEELEFPYGEETAALYIKKEYVDALKEYAYLTDEEIESGILMYGEEGSDYMELAEISIQRMEENVQ